MGYDMGEVKIYLCHYNSTDLFKTQVQSIRRFIKLKKDETLKIYGTVDGATIEKNNEMMEVWKSLDVIPIEMPFPHLGSNTRPTIYPKGDKGVCYGLCFNYIFNNYIKKDKHISMFIENDVIFIDDFHVTDYSNDYEVCGDVRFYTSYLPTRLCQFWLGFLIFNMNKMKNINIFNGDKKPVNINGRFFNVDAGGQTYNWISKTDKKNIKHISTVGSPPDYTPYKSPVCIVHNITDDIENLPYNLRTDYDPSFRCVNYENKFIHLERVAKENSIKKINWIKKGIKNDID